HENVARLHFRADANDAVRSKVLERLITQIRDVPRDFFRAELGIPGANLEFVDVNGSKDVFLDNTLADEDGVLEVVAIPRHEGDEHVAAQRQLAPLRAGTIRDDLALLDRLTLPDDDLLVDAGGRV